MARQIVYMPCQSVKSLTHSSNVFWLVGFILVHKGGPVYIERNGVIAHLKRYSVLYVHENFKRKSRPISHQSFLCFVFYCSFLYVTFFKSLLNILNTINDVQVSFVVSIIVQVRGNLYSYFFHDFTHVTQVLILVQPDYPNTLVETFISPTFMLLTK